jgi:hypothetical protein
MDMGDGGSLDNTGVLGMLQRGVKRLVVFLNSNNPLPIPEGPDTPLALRVQSRLSTRRESSVEPHTPSTPRDPEAPPTWDEWADDDILPLFGQNVDENALNYLGTHHGNNHVFPLNRLRGLCKKFQEKILAGDPLVVEETYPVLENAYWGIEGDWECEVLWVLLHDSANFRNLLPADTKAELDRGDKGEFYRFPNFLTFGQQRGKARIEISLTPRQVNLLSTFTEWTLMSQADKVVEFVSRPIELLDRKRKKINKFASKAELEAEMGLEKKVESSFEAAGLI